MLVWGMRHLTRAERGHVHFDRETGVGGAVGGVTGALVGMGIPEYEAKRYEGRLQKGGILVSVHCDTSEEVKRAKDILQRTGAEDISTAGEASADVKDVPSTRKAGTGY